MTSADRQVGVFFNTMRKIRYRAVRTCYHVGLARTVHLQIIGLEMLGGCLVATGRVLPHPFQEPDRVPVD